MLDTEEISIDDWNATPSRFQRHYHSGNYRRSDSSRSGRSGVKATLLDQPLCAIDGEGKSRDDGSHHYTQFCASWPSGRAMIESESLGATECLEFLLNLPEHHTYVGFGLSYDTNMWIRKLPRKVIDRLLDTGQAYWGNYRIRWIERKFFSVKRGKRAVTVYDVWANFQASFVAACKAWSVGTDAELDLVQRMKEQRGNFNDVDDRAISEYCYLECDLLRALCRKLFDAILQTPYRPNAVYGPGALASAAMRKHGVHKSMAELPDAIQQLTHYAYFGGRFDCAAFGWFSDVWQYDIKSAYPDQIRYLPCLAHAEWKHVTRGVDPIQPARYGMYQVEWELPEDTVWPPFPHRDAKGNVYYPYRGRGWYHGDEVQAAIELYGDAINVVTGYECVVKCEHKPFAFVDELFEIRKKLPYDQGVVFKLILNSIYGKLAQQVGTRDGKQPRFQCFYWAGAITAGTRAKILRNLAACPDQIIGIATDSLVALRRLDVEYGSELGQWDAKQLASYAQISNGVYHGVDADGKRVERSRGVGRSVLDWGMVRRDFVSSKGCGIHEFVGRSRFITLREARNRADRADVECRWIAADGIQSPKRRLSFWPTRRWPSDYKRAGPTIRLTPLQPADYDAPFESQPFRLKNCAQDVIDARMRFNAYDWQDYS